MDEIEVTGSAADRLRSLMVQALPDETINQAILAAWDCFTKDIPEKKNSYGRIDQHFKRSEFGQLVEAHLLERVKARIVAVCGAWDDKKIDDEIMSQLRCLVEKAANTSKRVFWEAIGENIVGRAVDQMGGRLKSCSCGRVYGREFSGNCSCGNVIY